jgi:large subunit ribosomal protein L13Ae
VEQVFEGCPPPFDKKKRMVIPEALRVTRLRPGRRYTNLGRMASEVGWKHWDTVKELEAKRKVKSEAYWAKKKDLIKVCMGVHPLFLCSLVWCAAPACLTHVLVYSDM